MENCYSHHNNREGMGYGVEIIGASMTVGGSEVVVTGSEFCYNRHDVASNSPETRFMVLNNYFRDNDPNQSQAAVDTHAQGGYAMRVVIRDNLFKNTRPIALRTGSIEITGNYFDPLCANWINGVPCQFAIPVHNSVYVPEVSNHDIYIGENINETGEDLVLVDTYNYPTGGIKYVAYNLYTDGELFEKTHTNYPPLSVDPKPLVGHIYITETGGNTAVENIQSNTWYDLHLMACDPQGWTNIAEVGVQIVNTDYNSYTTNMTTAGNFFPLGNYFIKSDGSNLYAREAEGSSSWTNVNGTNSLYVDGSNWSWTSSGTNRLHFKVRVKVLSNVAAGTWKLYGYVRDKNNNLPIAAWSTDQEGWDIALSGAAYTYSAYYAFDEGSGSTVSDSSGNKNTGSLNMNTTWVSGKIGFALEFAGGTNDYVSVPDSPSLDITGNLTITAWINPAILTDNAGIVDKFVGSFTGYRLLLRSDGKLRFWYGDGTAVYNYVVSAPNIIRTNIWQQVTVTKQNTNITFYVNGIAKTNSAISGLSNASIAVNTNALLIGKNIYNNVAFNGKIDDVKIYAKALTAAEVYGQLSSGIPFDSILRTGPSTLQLQWRDALNANWTIYSCTNLYPGPVIWTPIASPSITTNTGICTWFIDLTDTNAVSRRFYKISL